MEKRTVFVRTEKVENVMIEFNHYLNTSDVVSGKNQSFWQEVVEFEKEEKRTTKIQARKLIFELPLEWQTLQMKHLKKRCGKMIRKMLYGSVGYTYFIRTATNNEYNFHMIVLFSERMESDLFVVEKRDQYRCSETGKIVKSTCETAVKVSEKGTIKKDENGRALVNIARFGIKNKKFKTKGWLHQVKQMTLKYYRNYSVNYTLDSQARFTQVRYSGGTVKQKKMILSVNSYTQKIDVYIAKNPKSRKARIITDQLELLLQKNEFKEALEYMSKVLKLQVMRSYVL